MLERFHKYNTEKGLFRIQDKLLVAISGGVDSVVLCHLLKQYGANFALAHCNFGLRGEESNSDETFVEQFAEDLQVSIHIKSFSPIELSKERGISIQMAARELRYEWFKTLCIQKEYNYLLTAHHQNDTIETLLLNLTRGTGIAGLHGIQAKSSSLLRPLLFATKEELLNYANSNALSWREDSSNQSTKYYRNTLRLEVVPILKKINPNLEVTIQQSIEKISAAEQIFNTYIQGCKSEFMIKKDGSSRLIFAFLNEEDHPAVVLFELLKPFGFKYAQAKDIITHLKKDCGSLFYSRTHKLCIDRTELLIHEKSLNDDTTTLLIDHNSTSVVFDNKTKKIEIALHDSIEITSSSSSAYLNVKLLSFPLSLRKWEAGDYFYPLGMKGRKRISDFLTDRKIPLSLKSDIYVVTSNEELIWIVGYRIDERYKAIANQPTLVLTLK